jgi:hypothetical protein
VHRVHGARAIDGAYAVEGGLVCLWRGSAAYRLARKNEPHLTLRHTPGRKNSCGNVTDDLNRLIGCVCNGWSLSALPPKADIRQPNEHVYFVPKADLS